LPFTDYYKPNWFPRRYCKYAATNSPVIVHGTRPKTSPDSKTSTI